MNIEWQTNLEDSKKVVIFIDKEPWGEFPNFLFVRYLKTLKRPLTLKDLGDDFSNFEYKLCKEHALRYLAIRAHFLKELERKLIFKGFREETIKKTLDECIDLGYLDDLQHVRAVIAREQRKGYGPYLIVQKIRALGNISQEKLDELMKEVEDHQFETLQSLICKRYANASFEDPKQKIKVFQALKRRGFSSEVLQNFFTSNRNLFYKKSF